MLSLFLFFPMTAVGDTLDMTDTTSSTDFWVSKNVTLTYTVSTGQDGFTAISSHKLADTLYGGGSDTTLVFRNVGGKVKGTDYATVPGSANATTEFGAPIGANGWLPI
jgi:hypothetical protein